MSIGDPIYLREYEDWTGELLEEDRSFILTELARKFNLRRTLSGTQFVLNPSQYVGVIVLPSGRRLESAAKVPVSNLFWMLAVAFDLPQPFRDEVAKFDRLDELLEFVAIYFTDRVEDRINRGLHRSYIEFEENLQTIRGRIDFPHDLRRNSVLRHHTYCRFAEFTWDIPENQMLRQVAHLLSGWNFKPQLRSRLIQLDRALYEISITTMPAGTIDRFQYYRLNEDYRPLHRLCRLFLEGASLSEDMGPFDFRTFMLDMNRLFELFVSHSLGEREPHGVRVELQDPTYLDKDKRVTVQPDIAVKLQGTVRLVADAKYKIQEPEEFRNHDLYQILAYCLAKHVERGMLIYPQHTVPDRTELQIIDERTTLHLTTLDLRGDLVELRRSCDSLAREVFDFAGVHDGLVAKGG